VSDAARIGLGERSAAILWDGADAHNLEITELTEVFKGDLRMVVADVRDRDTGERYLLTATRIEAGKAGT
jgi:uncharacterized DUF497 family protein